jgi:hypothetical protein
MASEKTLRDSLWWVEIRKYPNKLFDDYCQALEVERVLWQATRTDPSLLPAYYRHVEVLAVFKKRILG